MHDSQTEPRNIIARRLQTDLVGPGAIDEILQSRPSDIYLTGILYPQRHEFSAEDDDRLATEEGEDEVGGGSAEEENPGLTQSSKPASGGLSFAVAGAEPVVRVVVECGRYRAENIGTESETRGSKVAAGEQERSKHIAMHWRRTGQHAAIDVHLNVAQQLIRLEPHGIDGLDLFVRSAAWKDVQLITLALVNRLQVAQGDKRREIEEKSFFQVRISAEPHSGTRLVPRPATRIANDEDGRASALLYRNAVQFASGHTCSADWEIGAEGDVVRVFTSWIPRAVVMSTSSEGASQFRHLTAREDGLQPLSPEWLAAAPADQIYAALHKLPAAYGEWITEQRQQVAKLPQKHRPQADLHLDECQAVQDRVREAIALLASDPDLEAAFRLANRAMVVQRRWLNPLEQEFLWRPFQLAFLLLTLPSVSRDDHMDRNVMDLLWFPTGGGKTEAYLSLIAYTVFLRRLKQPAPQSGGVTVLMRYTLRLLTAQQFQRAAALTLACEYLRQNGHGPVPAGRLAGASISIGLWVGGDATPNSYEDAAEALTNGGLNSPAQIENCPACGKRLRWTGDRRSRSIRVSCTNEKCDVASLGGHLPVWTVDEDIYRELPSVLIGTIDKFAQLPRKKESGRLFGVGTPHMSVSLIIQDELHLISGPLGTMAGLYEIAIDELCSRGAVRPKIIGSTATIRRAREQINALFQRETRQFPPPGLTAGDSGFAVTDDTGPGRLYLGVSTAGRSAKFTLQAVCGSLLQAAAGDLGPSADRDPYWTLVAYFNSLRELGGALVLMLDDVPDSVEEYARRREEHPRTASVIEELTSRVSQIEIRDKLEDLARRWDHENRAVDVLLATNMLSVGVDIPRLGLMVVNGQPKGIAEYIQATSRVGRGSTPGIVVTVYNNAKARDRSHFETFQTWHSMLYRDVEATSVTPFASRARDRALHAPLVAMVRHLVAGMESSPRVTERTLQEVRDLADRITQRARHIDPDEVEAVASELNEFISEWIDKDHVQHYWNDFRLKESLLVSAEKAAALRLAGMSASSATPTPNSMRNVDPGTPFIVVEALKAEGDGDAESE